MYKPGNGLCDSVLRPGIDYVYTRFILGNQGSITKLLNDKLKAVQGFIPLYDQDCVKQVYRVLCHYYLPPCGNATRPTSPSSICHEECHRVKEECAIVWHSVVSALEDIKPTINCSDTSKLLFPVPHCCTGALVPFMMETSPEATVQGEESGTVAASVVAGSVIGVIVAITVAFVIVVIVVLFLSKRHKRKQLKRVQQDILAM